MESKQIELIQFKSGWGAYNGFNLDMWEEEGHTCIGMPQKAIRQLAHKPIFEHLELGCIGDDITLAFNFATYDEREFPFITFNHDTQPSELAAQLRSYADRLEATSADMPGAGVDDAKYHRQWVDAVASRTAESMPETNGD